MAPMEADYAASYGDLYARHWWFRAREDHVLRQIARIDPGRPMRILDIGCGDGLMWPKLKRFGDVEGIEPDASLIPANSPNRPSIEVAPFPGRPRQQRYDLIVMLDVLEHIQDDRGALARVVDLLAPGGHYVMTVPALMLLWSEFDAVNGHFRRYRVPPLRQLLQQSGLDVLNVNYYYFWPVLPLLGRRALFRSQDVNSSQFVKVPPRPLNRLLHITSALEHRVTSALGAPFGSSIIAVARKPA